MTCMIGGVCIYKYKNLNKSVNCIGNIDNSLLQLADLI